ncbi:MAG: aldehyde dehydrogenase family protein [Spirochaetales bacterium]|nr:aldehyde dehydrogenase family protein [Spirochaetales bacterium]
MAELYAPATGKKIADLKTSDLKVLQESVKKAVRVQKEWAALPYRIRRKMLLKLREYLVRNADTVAGCIADCTGKTMNDAFAAEVLPCTLAAGYYVKAIGKMLHPKRVKRSSIMFFNKNSYLVNEPWGVIGIISPWNYPFGIPFHEVFMALTAGNAVVLKVATQVQPVGDIFTEMLRYAGLPEGLCTVINLPGSLSGKAFIESGINKLFFTGSVAVGKELMKLASERLIPVSLELGGNDAMIVCSDANLFRAAAGAVWGGISNCGESCGGVERIYVLDSVYDEFMRELNTMVRGLRQGTGFDADFGSLTTKKQKQTVQAHIEDALKKGAVISARSEEVKGDLFHPAVVLENVTHDMDVMKDETFGPVLAVCRVNSEEEAIALANDSYLGLTASVWTRNKKRAKRIAARLEAGAITVNDHLMSHGMAETPWGGYKMSSIGRSHGGPGLNEVFQSKVIVHDTTHFFPRNIWWHPYSESVYKGLKAAMLTLFGKGLIKFPSAFRLVAFYLKQLKK